MNERVTLTKERYEELLQAEKVLAALYATGVDNWERYNDALDILGDEAV